MCTVFLPGEDDVLRRRTRIYMVDHCSRRSLFEEAQTLMIGQNKTTYTIGF